jgi:hypothetical protein
LLDPDNGSATIESLQRAARIVALVEKDWYVVKALVAIAAVDTGDFGLAFGGGTARGRLLS